MTAAAPVPPEPAPAEVAVIGGGPVGLLSALLCARLGHSVVVLERQTEPYALPRAVGLASESLRILALAGLDDALEGIIERFPPDSSFATLINGERTVLRRVPLSSAGPGWPDMVAFNQPDLERLLEERVRRHELIDLRRGADMIDLDQREEGVTVRAAGRTPGAHPGVHEWDVSIAIGSDGANSTVRSHLGIPVHDEGFSHDWLVVDLLPTEPRRWDPYLAQILDPSRPATAVAAGPPGRRRFEFMLLPGETPEEMNDRAVAWRLLAGWGADPGNATLVRHTVYTFHARLARQWRSGRVVLAGDAAHLMPPFIGQGLNSGIRDAAALAWRVDLILRGRAPIGLLGQYATERSAHVGTVMAQAVELGRMICVTDPVVAAERDRHILAAAGETGAAPPPWRLGPGSLLAGDDLAGLLSPQAVIRSVAGRGAVEHVLAHGGFFMVSPIGDPAAGLGRDARRVWDTLGGASARVTGDSVAPGEVADLGCTYPDWFRSHGVGVVLVRPDLYIYGTAGDLAGAEDLVLRLGADLDLVPGPRIELGS